MKIKRSDFLKDMMRIVFGVFLAGMALILGKRTVEGSTCSSCPGKGICRGEIDCIKYLKTEK
ncbi:MAG: hypothetical protein GXY51_09145 [Bacteroidetes bacterium]|nr:hypothetical protein [Bacteroidota bacterium]